MAEGRSLPPVPPRKPDNLTIIILAMLMLAAVQALVLASLIWRMLFD